jgi:alkylation response protein AidB-like acyl-CoA dehydrogenase
MDFKLDAKSVALREEIRKFAQEELPKDWVPPTLADGGETKDFEFDLSTARKLAKRGWLVRSWPREYGGGGASVWEQTTYELELSYWGIPGAMMGTSGVQWVGPSLMLFGSEEQRKKYLPLIASGDRDGVWCTGYSEPNAGSDFASIQTKAVRAGDSYIINGQKIWTSSGHRARWCWLAAKTDPDAPKKHRGISLFVVDMKSPGITTRPILNYYGAHHFNEVFFDNVKVPAENLVGQENKGWYQLMQALAFERRMVAPMVYGACKRVAEELVEYVKNTRAEGKYLAKDPIIRHKLAEVAMGLETLRLFAYQITWVIGRGTIPTYESSRNKLLADEVVKMMAIAGAEILGAFSQVARDSTWARLDGAIQGMYLVFPGFAIGGGTAEIEKSIVAQFKLGLPKSY